MCPYCIEYIDKARWLRSAALLFVLLLRETRVSYFFGRVPVPSTSSAGSQLRWNEDLPNFLYIYLTSNNKQENNKYNRFESPSFQNGNMIANYSNFIMYDSWTFYLIVTVSSKWRDEYHEKYGSPWDKMQGRSTLHNRSIDLSVDWWTDSRAAVHISIQPSTGHSCIDSEQQLAHLFSNRCQLVLFKWENMWCEEC